MIIKNTSPIYTLYLQIKEENYEEGDTTVLVTIEPEESKTVEVPNKGSIEIVELGL